MSNCDKYANGVACLGYVKSEKYIVNPKKECSFTGKKLYQRKKCWYMEIATFGCRINIVESEKIREALHKAMQHCEVDNAELHSLVIINSCAVTDEAERQLRQKVRSIKRRNPQALIALTGCVAQLNGDKYKEMPEVTYLLDNDMKLDEAAYRNIITDIRKNRQSDGQTSIIRNEDRAENVIQNGASVEGDAGSQHSASKEQQSEYVPESFTIHQYDAENTHQNEQGEKDEKTQNIGEVRSHSELIDGQSQKTAEQTLQPIGQRASAKVDSRSYSRGFLQVQNGCDHRCTFCVIPYARGKSRSLTIGQVIQHTKDLVAQGVHEVTLSGVDITDYGKDLPGKPSLGQMVKRLLRLVPDLRRLRLSSLDVAEIDHYLLDAIINEPRLMPHLHLSLQSLNNFVLKVMKRRHSREQVIEFVQAVRAVRPNVTFGADIIAGFPLETDEMFEETYRTLETLRIGHLHVFPFSARQGVPAANMPQVEIHLRRQRAALLRELGQNIRQQHYRSLIGSEANVLLEGKGKGRAEDYSLVHIESDPLATARESRLIPGALYQVTIKEANSDSTVGVVKKRH